MRAWKPPNHNPHRKAVLNENLLVARPLHIDTEKASIESAMLMLIRDIRSMFNVRMIFDIRRLTYNKKVGMTRFELAASSSRTKRATGLRYIPKLDLQRYNFFLNFKTLELWNYRKNFF